MLLTPGKCHLQKFVHSWGKITISDAYSVHPLTTSLQKYEAERAIHSIFYIQSIAPTVLYFRANFPYYHRIPCCGCVKQPTVCTGRWKYVGDWSAGVKKCHLFLQGCEQCIHSFTHGENFENCKHLANLLETYTSDVLLSDSGQWPGFLCTTICILPVC